MNDVPTKKTTKKISSFEGAIAFYKETRPKALDLIKEATTISEQVGTSPSFVDKDGAPMPLNLNNQENIDLEEIEKWLGTNIYHYSTLLEETLPAIDTSMELVPNLLQGIAKEARSGTTNLTNKLSLATEDILKGLDKTKELDKIEKELNKKIGKLNFFKEEVDERFELFKESLIDYVCAYSILNHIVDCAEHIADGKPKDIQKFLNQVGEFKEPF